MSFSTVGDAPEFTSRETGAGAFRLAGGALGGGLGGSLGLLRRSTTNAATISATSAP